jgi:integrase
MERDLSQAEVYVVAPTGERVRFAVRARWNRGRSNQVTQTLKLPEIDSTNRLYRTGKISREEAHAALTDLAHRLTKRKEQQKPLYCTANLKILNSYFEKIYGPREIKDRRSAYNRLKRAISAIGQLKLSTASPNELFEAVRNYEPNPQKRKAILSAVGQLLKYIGRHDVPVPRIRKARPKIRHLSLSEFQSVVAQITDKQFSLLCWAFFATGCRPGELFALDSGSLRNDESVFVADSIDRDTKQLGPTKTGDQRHATFIGELFDQLKGWLAVPHAEKMGLRAKPHSKWFRKAVRKAFPNDQSKWAVTFYDIRHSYAIHCLTKGVPIDLVAQSLGNSEAVCNEFYTGYKLTAGGVSAMAKILAANG